MGTKRCLIGFLLIAGTGCGIEGLHNANPTTRVTVDPASHRIEYRDNKDNDLQVKGFKVETPGGTTAQIDELTLRNNASEVRTANYQQMLGMAQQAAVNWAGATDFTNAVFEGVSRIIPLLTRSQAVGLLGKLQGFNVSTPYGTFARPGLSPEQVAALLELARPDPTAHGEMQ
jgi:hypothetical protein